MVRDDKAKFSYHLVTELTPRYYMIQKILTAGRFARYSTKAILTQHHKKTVKALYIIGKEEAAVRVCSRA